MEVLRDEMREVGLKKWEFCETLAAKMWKESQPPSKGMFGNNHFCHFAEVEEPME